MSDELDTALKLINQRKLENEAQGDDLLVEIKAFEEATEAQAVDYKARVGVLNDAAKKLTAEGDAVEKQLKAEAAPKKPKAKEKGR